uniref:Cytochrome b5 heme-binding domain-containing protein n=1 Tax=Chromera velia CCMP2878 TaxID=1169474 RepID=A0A0G4HD34_9ALVE|eukprot:Cvel_26372.t1-p1 / transcript=Cvel_26372.t1 / gene=Cvel_26372 / organism=Chromera_velia_CCMP2878 / gene_product=Cytochrome b5 isoform A, putative / transcript_product=Cytochrome b5 isoform A, putative / location=Cvel_scaffold3124:16843-19508(-) / protein_length=648 / sequence_SO=supercontig / SO=protein_coding / is_pseudo=false
MRCLAVVALVVSMRTVAHASGDAPQRQLGSISFSEISKHNSASDCWSCITGTVYDLTGYINAHEGGGPVIEFMCGSDGTATLLKAHSTAELGDVAGAAVGTCADYTAEAGLQANILDVAAFGVFIILPILLTFLFINVGSIRFQDVFLRRPIAAPMKGFMGETFNGMVEMSWGVLTLILLYLVATALFIYFWVQYMQTYYPAIYVYPAAFGRVAIYAISLAGMTGTRRVTFTWWLLRLPYEKALKLHYVIGIVAAYLAIAHAVQYLLVFGPGLPGSTAATGWGLLVATGVVYLFTLTSIRIRWYGVFRITHFIAPLILIASIFHIILLKSEGGGIYSGLLGAVGFTALASGLWLFDKIWTTIDTFKCPVTVVQGPLVLPSDGGDQYLSVTVKKPKRSWAGSWYSITSLDGKSVLSHPFTAIVKDEGKTGPCELEFVWKVQGKGKEQWTGKTLASVAEKKELKMFVAGPFGGGIGAFGKPDQIKALVFVVAGVGVTPAASIIPHIANHEGRQTYVVWSFRSRSLYSHLKPYFSALPAENCHFHYTGKGGSAQQKQEGDKGDLPTPVWSEEEGLQQMGEEVKKTRPDLREILPSVQQHAEQAGLLDLGVFVCGPEGLVKDVLKVTAEMNKRQKGSANAPYVHFHSESFQM